MKIDFIISGLLGGGAERVMAILVNNLAEKNHDVGLITFKPGDAYDINKRVRLVKLYNGLLSIQKLRNLINLILHYKKKKNRPDIIVSFITQLNFITIIVAKLYGIKIIASEHNSHLRSQKPIFLTKFTRTYLYPFADYVTVLTAFDIDFYKKKNINVIVMPNPCTFTPIQSIPIKKDNVILAVGNLNRYEHKGFDNLMDIATQVLPQYPGWILKIVGAGDKGLSILKKQLNDHLVRERIIFTGFQTNVKDIMVSSEIFILPSRFEGLPMVLLEAMSQGMSCIAYDCKTGPSDIITNNIDGILIEDQNKDAMINGLCQLIEDSELRQTLSQKALKNLNRFSVETITQKWEELFDELKS